MKGKVRYIPILDSLRGFAALAVCLHHFINTTTGYITSPFLLEFFEYGRCGVHLFFVISGFVIPWSMYTANYKPNNFFTFLLKRFLRLEPPYLFSILLVLIVLVARQHFYAENNQPLSYAQFFFHIGYLIPFTNYKWLNPVYWTLAIEFQYYFFIALLYPLLIRNSLYIRTAIYLAIVALSFTTGSQFLPYWLPVFFIGIVLFLYKVDKIRNIELICSLIFLLTTVFLKYNANVGIFVFVLLGLVSILFFETVEVSGFSKLGKWSYSLYLTHSIIGATVINVLSHKYTESWQKFAVILLGTVITLVFSWIMYLVVESPSKKLSSKIRINQPKSKGAIASEMAQ